MPKIVDRAERRTAIAAAAVEAIADDGIEAVTMKSIAARAGGTTGAVTHYFADKDDVVLEALLLVDASMQARFEAVLADGAPLLDALLAALPHDAQSQRDWSVWRVFGDRAARSTSLLKQYRASDDAWRKAAARLLAQRRGCAIDDVILDAELVVAAVDAVGMEASIDQSAWPVTRQRALLARLLDVLDR